MFSATEVTLNNVTPLLMARPWYNDTVFSARSSLGYVTLIQFKLDCNLQKTLHVNNSRVQTPWSSGIPGKPGAIHGPCVVDLVKYGVVSVKW